MICSPESETESYGFAFYIPLTDRIILRTAFWKWETVRTLSVSRAVRPKSVFIPVATTSRFIWPIRTIDPEYATSFFFLSTGSDSPVSAEIGLGRFGLGPILYVALTSQF